MKTQGLNFKFSSSPSQEEKALSVKANIPKDKGMRLSAPGIEGLIEFFDTYQAKSPRQQEEFFEKNPDELEKLKKKVSRMYALSGVAVFFLLPALITTAICSFSSWGVAGSILASILSLCCIVMSVSKFIKFEVNKESGAFLNDLKRKRVLKELLKIKEIKNLMPALKNKKEWYRPVDDVHMPSDMFESIFSLNLTSKWYEKWTQGHQVKLHGIELMMLHGIITKHKEHLIAHEQQWKYEEEKWKSGVKHLEESMSEKETCSDREASWLTRAKRDEKWFLVTRKINKEAMRSKAYRYASHKQLLIWFCDAEGAGLETIERLQSATEYASMKVLESRFDSKNKTLYGLHIRVENDMDLDWHKSYIELILKDEKLDVIVREYSDVSARNFWECHQIPWCC